MECLNTAVNGPAGVGRNTIAKLAAEKLGSVYMDTGAMYRSMALYFIRQGISPKDEEAIARACSQVEVAIRYADGAQRVILNGEDVSGLIHSEEVGYMTSATSVYGPARQKLAQLQKQLARKADVIMDGRDIDTCVLLDAPAKIYLTTFVKIHAGRRFRELEEKGMVCDIREVERGIEKRDYRDMHREDLPLRQAEDVVLLDSSHIAIGQVVGSIIHIARERGYEG